MLGGGIYGIGNIHSRVCVFGRRPRFVLGLRIVFQCRMKNLQSLIDDLGVAWLLFIVGCSILLYGWVCIYYIVDIAIGNCLLVCVCVCFNVVACCLLIRTQTKHRKLPDPAMN